MRLVLVWILAAGLSLATAKEKRQGTTPPIIVTPIVTRPIVTIPIITEPPIVTAPIVTPPVITPPVVTPPVVSPPVTTPPVETTPRVTSPAVSPGITSPGEGSSTPSGGTSPSDSILPSLTSGESTIGTGTVTTTTDTNLNPPPENTGGNNSTETGTGTGTATGTDVSPNTSTNLPTTITQDNTIVTQTSPIVTTLPPTEGQSSELQTQSLAPTSTIEPTTTQYFVTQILPENTQVPIKYEPSNCWESTGENNNNNGGGGGDPTASAPLQVITNPAEIPPSGPAENQVVSFCNNGTKIAKQVGSTISLKFKGVEVSLLVAPSSWGGAYKVTLDDEEAVEYDSYKQDVDSCVIEASWTRVGLVDGEHNVKVEISGASAASSAAGGTQLEFNGLVYKGRGGDASGSKSGVSKWIIIGAAVGGVILLLALLAIIIFCVRKRLRKSKEANEIRSRTASVVAFPGPHSAPSSPYPQHARSMSEQSAGYYPASISHPGSPDLRTSVYHPVATNISHPGSPEPRHSTHMHQPSGSWSTSGGVTPMASPHSPPMNIHAPIPQDPFNPQQYEQYRWMHNRGASTSSSRNPFEQPYGGQ